MDSYNAKITKRMEQLNQKFERMYHEIEVNKDDNDREEGQGQAQAFRPNQQQYYSQQASLAGHSPSNDETDHIPQYYNTDQSRPHHSHRFSRGESSSITSKEQSLDMLIKFNSMPIVRKFNRETIFFIWITLVEHLPHLQKELGPDFHTSNYMYYSFIKKLPQCALFRYMDLVRATNSTECFATLKEWIDHKWETFRLCKEKCVLDKELYDWQQGKPVPQLAQNEPIIVEADFVEEGTDGQGNFVISVEVEDCFKINNGEIVPIERILVRNKDIKRNKYSPFQRQPSLPKFQKKTFQLRSSFTPAPKASFKCHYCRRSDHALWSCKEFAALGFHLRLKLVSDKSLCFMCLNAGHFVQDCKVKFVCDVEGCGHRHHRLLHTIKYSLDVWSLYQQQGIDSDLSSDEEDDRPQQKQSSTPKKVSTQSRKSRIQCAKN